MRTYRVGVLLVAGYLFAVGMLWMPTEVHAQPGVGTGGGGDPTPTGELSWFAEALKGIDSALQPTIAATLIGFTATALTFLVGKSADLRSSIDKKIAANEPSQVEADLIKTWSEASAWILRGLGSFLVLLTSTIAFDGNASVDAEYRQSLGKLFLDIGLGSMGFVGGLVCFATAMIMLQRALAATNTTTGNTVRAVTDNLKNQYRTALVEIRLIEAEVVPLRYARPKDDALATQRSVRDEAATLLTAWGISLVPIEEAADAEANRILSSRS